MNDLRPAAAGVTRIAFPETDSPGSNKSNESLFDNRVHRVLLRDWRVSVRLPVDFALDQELLCRTLPFVCEVSRTTTFCGGRSPASDWRTSGWPSSRCGASAVNWVSWVPGRTGELGLWAIMPARLQLYYITDRTQIKSRTLDTCIAEAIDAGVDWVQIREKDLPARRLLGLAEAARSTRSPCGIALA